MRYVVGGHCQVNTINPSESETDDTPKFGSRNVRNNMPEEEMHKVVDVILVSI